MTDFLPFGPVIDKDMEKALNNKDIIKKIMPGMGRVFKVLKPQYIQLSIQTF